MKDLRIENRERWQRRHFKTLTSAYNKSPWFEHYQPELEQLYSASDLFLMDWNIRCLNWICDKLSIPTKFSLTDGYIDRYDEELFADKRNWLTPPSLKMQQSSSDRYAQVFEDRHGFLPNLSVLDRLFCEGPDWTANH